MGLRFLVIDKAPGFQSQRPRPPERTAKVGKIHKLNTENRKKLNLYTYLDSVYYFANSIFNKTGKSKSPIDDKSSWM